MFRVLGTRTGSGGRFDETAVQDGLSQLAIPRVANATRGLLDTISVASLATVAVGMLAFAAARRKRDLAAAAAVLLAGANVTTQVLKHELATRSGSPMELSRSFPSGHATVAMSVALAVLLLAPPRLRLPVALVGGLYASAVGIALVVTAAHYPSDVAAGFCVAGVWAAVAALFITRPPTGAPSARAVLSVATVAVLSVAIAVLARPEAVVHVRLHLRLAEAAVGIAATAAVVITALAYAIATRSASATRS